MIVSDQKVTVSALNERVLKWWKASECFWERRRVCSCSCSDVQVSRDQSVRVLRVRRVLPCGLLWVPIYRGGELQSRCNGTPSSGGYEIVGSVTAREFIAGSCKETLRFVWSGLVCSIHPLCGKEGYCK